MKGETPEIRFWSKVTKTDSCWLWTGAKSRNGYGLFWLQGELVRARRTALEWETGKQLEDGYRLDTTCDVAACIRPGHVVSLNVRVDNRDQVLSRLGSPSEPEVAWAAGFIDGDGCIRLRKTRSMLGVVVQAVQVDPRPLRELERLFKGSVNGPYQRPRSDSFNRRPTYHWVVWAQRAADALIAMRPYLHEKGEEADVAIEYHGLYLSHRTPGVPTVTDLSNTQESYIRRLAELKARSA